MRRGGVIVIFVAGSLVSAACAEPVELTTDTEISDTGYYTLTWQPPNGDALTEVEIEESTSPDFAPDATRTLYTGIDHATVLSGRRDGKYHYRARYGGGKWGTSIEIAVQHHSLAHAVGILIVGAVVFLATATLIVAGHLKYRRELKTAGGSDA